MDFGFGGFIGYGKGMPVGLVNEELNERKMYDGCGKTKEVRWKMLSRRCTLLYLRRPGYLRASHSPPDSTFVS